MFDVDLGVKLGCSRKEGTKGMEMEFVSEYLRVTVESE